MGIKNCQEQEDSEYASRFKYDHDIDDIEGRTGGDLSAELADLVDYDCDAIPTDD